MTSRARKIGFADRDAPTRYAPRGEAMREMSLRGRFRLELLGVGAMNSPRFRPAGLLVEHGTHRVMFDGGPGAAPRGKLDAWLVTDERAELIREIRRLARRCSVEPTASSLELPGLRIERRDVVHTSHRTFGYLLEAEGFRVAWAPEFLEFPAWARGCDLLFADAAGFGRPIRFVGRVGGHAAAVDVACEALRRHVGRLVFAHIGRPSIAALDAGGKTSFGTFGRDGQVFYPRRWR